MGIAILHPTPPLPSPHGYKGPRGEILLELKREGGCTARALGDKLGLSLNAVRHHLKELEAEGVVSYRREQRGMGAPTFAYSLSKAGEALFPRRYEATLAHVLDHLVEREGRGAAVAALEEQFGALTRRLRAGTDGEPAARRLGTVAEALAVEGYMAEWKDEGSGHYVLTEHNCAIRAVAERFPEVCAAEARMLENVLGAAVERRAHVLSGCTACEYTVRFAPQGPVALSPRPDQTGTESRDGA